MCYNNNNSNNNNNNNVTQGASSITIFIQWAYRQASIISKFHV